MVQLVKFFLVGLALIFAAVSAEALPQRRGDSWELSPETDRRLEKEGYRWRDPEVPYGCLEMVKKLRLPKGGLPVQIDIHGIPVMGNDLPSVLRHDITVLSEMRRGLVLQSLQEADEEFRRLVKPMNPHMSLGHSWGDQKMQSFLVTANVPLHQFRVAISLMVDFLHLLDDWIDRRDLGAYSQMEFTSSKHMDELLFHLDSSGELRKLFSLGWRRILMRIGGFIGDETVPARWEFLEFAVNRMLMSERMFSGQKKSRQWAWGEHLRLLKEFNKANPGLNMLLEELDPRFVAMSVKALYESVEAVSPGSPNARVATVKSLLWGPGVFHHNADKELEAGELVNGALLPKVVVRDNFLRVFAFARTLPEKEQKQIFAEFLPGVQSFRDVWKKKKLLGLYYGLIAHPVTRKLYGSSFVKARDALYMELLTGKYLTRSDRLDIFEVTRR